MISIRFRGVSHDIDPSRPFTIGREADLVLGTDNAHLQPVFLIVQKRYGFWWLDNTGSRLSATVSVRGGGVEASLAPGEHLPLVFPVMDVWVAAGDMTYDMELRCDESPFRCVAAPHNIDGGIGSVALTSDQRLLIVALAENVLRNSDRGMGAIPTSAAAANRLGWPITKFNRKLDNVCGKLERLGVAGLHGGPTMLAVSRKARLVEYTIGAGIVTRDDLPLLPPTAPAPEDLTWGDDLWPDMAPKAWLRAG